MRYFPAMLTALVLALSASSANAQPRKDPWAFPPPSGSVAIPLATVPPHDAEKPDKDYSPAPRQTCAEELEEAKIENAYLKGRVEAREDSHFQLWPRDQLAYWIFIAPWIAWVFVAIARACGESSKNAPPASKNPPPERRCEQPEKAKDPLKGDE